MVELIGNPPPFKAGTAPFTPPGTELQYETAYWIAGNLKAGSVPLICLHGGPGVPGRYLRPLGRLNKMLGIPVILYDQIGSGSSTLLPEKNGDVDFWTYDLFIAQLHSLISHLRIETYDLFGHSWGGMLSSLYVVRQPKGLRKWILCSAPSNIAKRIASTLETRKQLPGDAPQILARGEADGTQDSAEYKQAYRVHINKHMCRVIPMPQDFLDSLTLAGQDKTVASTMGGHSNVTYTGILKDFDIVPELPKITKETVPGGMLVMFGKYDGVVVENQTPYWTDVKADVQWKQFDESSHMAFLEETEAFLTTVAEFLLQ